MVEPFNRYNRLIDIKDLMRKLTAKIRMKIAIYMAIFGIFSCIAPISFANNTDFDDDFGGDFESLSDANRVNEILATAQLDGTQAPQISATDDSRTGSQTNVQSDPQAGSQANVQVATQADPRTNVQTATQTDNQSGPQADPRTNVQTATQTDAEKEQEQFLDRLNEELKISKTEYYSITRNIRETRTRLDAMKKDMSELQKQVQYFDDQISEISEKLFTVVRQVVRTENEIMRIYDDIELKNTAMEYQKQLLREYVQNLYIYGDTYLDVDQNGNIDAFKILLSEGETSDILKEIKYLGILEETGTRLIEKLVQLNEELDAKRVELETKKTYLDNLRKELATKKQTLDSEKAAKENMLVLTKNQDQIYRAMLAESIKQQQESLAEVQTYQATLEFIKGKIEEEGTNFDINKYKDFLGKKFISVYDFQRMPASADGFVWPTMPTRGISAYFHDPSYRGYFGVQHNAIDIRVPQGTPVMSAADGVVYKAKDNGYGYSYIMLVHHNGLMTTYGHISNIMVEEGQLVKAGQAIGLSGGMPGTKGAGYMTTGPHLHFEVLKNGAYTDPLRYLPLQILSEENVDALPEGYKDDWERAVLESVGV